MLNSVIALNGCLPQKVFLRQWKHLPLIAVDGAANRLMKLGFSPNLVTGDLDSSLIELLPSSTQIIETADQNYADFEKCLLYLQQHAKEFFPALVVGMAGGDFDHQLHNVATFMRYAKELPMVFYNDASQKDPHIGFASSVSDLELAPQSIVSLVPYPEAQISSYGLAWPLQNEKLELLGKSGIRNTNIEKKISIHIHRGHLLSIIHWPRQNSRESLYKLLNSQALWNSISS